MPKKTLNTESQESSSMISKNDESSSKLNIENIGYIKLINGIELISLIMFDDNNSTLILKDPMKVVVEKDPLTGMTYFILVDFMAYSCIKETNISYAHIITVFPPSDEIIDYYFTSLRYSREYQYPKLKEGIKGATKYLQDVMEAIDNEKENNYNENNRTIMSTSIPKSKLN